MQLYNTLTRQIEEIEPLNDRTVRVYSCGPTLYDHIHIGNLSSFIFADTLRRVVKATGKEVKHVMNFTDVDDKTIRRSREKYGDLEPMEALLKLTAEYGKVFLEDMAAAGNDVDSFEFIKATDSIEAMQTLIRELHDKGFAYLADDGVYFSIDAYQKSGKKYGQLTEVTASSTSEARIQNDEYDKESAHDFALWKKQKPGEPAWEFELDGQDMKGRPGWHIECSAMSRQTLGQPFDIHTGGVDLIFPHHENEIAQSTAADGSIYAKHFAHNEHLLVDGQKMSKSLNNFYTLEDIRAKGYDPLAFRLLVLQGHYRKQGHFTWENLEAAANRLKVFRDFANLQWNLIDDAPAFGSSQFEIDEAVSHMSDDLNSPQALASLQGQMDVIYDIAVKEKGGLPKANSNDLKEMLTKVDELFGLKLLNSKDIDPEQRDMINRRLAAKQTKDWGKADQLRGQLAERGIGLRDTPRGAIWYRL
jgi:cysteinyl-tRNA synthetase